jgi:hypothetical protein
MKLKMVLGFTLLFAFVFHTQNAKGQNAPPTDWYELQYFQCDPLSCESDGGPFTNGSVSTTVVGPCFNGLVLQTGAASFLSNCEAPYFLTSGVSSEGSSFIVHYGPGGTLFKSYIVEGLLATSSILDDTGSTVSIYLEIKWCNGHSIIGVPQSGPC